MSDKADAPVITSHGTKLLRTNLSRTVAPCPKCETASKRHSIGKRHLREIGISGPTVLEIVYSKHYCTNCRKYFSIPMDHLALPSGRFTKRVRRTAIDLVAKEALTLDNAARRMRQKYHVFVPPTTLHDWVVDEMVADCPNPASGTANP